MNWKGHILLGLFFMIVLIIINIVFSFIEFGVFDYFLIVIFTGYYSLLPDIDIGTSKSFKFTFFLLLGLLSVGIWVDNKWFVWLPVILMVLILLLKHRGLTHKFWFGFLVSLITIFISWYLPIFCMVAYLSHIWLGDKK